MMLTHSVVVARPSSEVFGIAGNPDNDPLWGELIVASRKVSAGALGCGTTFEQTASILGARFSAVIEVTEYEPNRIVCFKTDSPVHLEHRRSFEPVAGGVLLTFDLHLDMPRDFQLAGSLFGPIAKRRMEADLTGFKQFVESRTPQPVK
jgi:hypothetical protein